MLIRKNYENICIITDKKNIMTRTKGSRKTKSAYTKEYKRELVMLANGISIRKVAKISGHSVNTIRKLKTML